MRFDPDKFKDLAKKNFEKAWILGKEVLSSDLDKQYPRLRYKFGKSHPVYDTIQALREAYLRLGFSEVQNPLYIEDVHVHKQFGPEGSAVLDRCFYLATLPRPDIGISAKQLRELEKLGIDIKKKDALQEVFRSYKKGTIDGDELLLEISKALEIENELATKILEKVFPEIKELKPKPSGMTLRSHMTSSWFITLGELKEKIQLPVKLFSVDRCFRREQKEDPQRLSTYHSASCVIMDEDVNAEEGKSISEGLLAQFGFENIKFKPDEKRSKYYVPDTQTEVFVLNQKTGKWIEIATFGIYSPFALANYGIEYPVLNLGLGVERLAMVLYGAEDVRELSYPQFKEIKYSDLDLASMIYIKNLPVSRVGFEISRGILEVCENHANEDAPCEYIAYRGELFGKEIEVKVFEVEKGKKLLGPAAFNYVVVEDGNIKGLPKENGVSTGIRYIDGISYAASYEIEKGFISGKKEVSYRVPIVRSLADINLVLEDAGRRYITSNEKQIDVRGPVFISILAREV
ncbi:MAG: O-phosphoserine--tRNA ligase [Candidatus Hydrothermarchaeota archaeon]